ncbi:CRISPR system precrRNA processing endoribonuclease RAMP protein Cas6 [Teredinibacter turnerae]|uniref:CRISPR system precrRNA processing endoribonuclease RAMP protein Cas6 n=1 Tax=Teredinibacter turnerae TaxID=2426 RepID=UPI0004061E11|nr:CRISPR system precrRNA processing endoribonuclease RAMP protein Cas6 [Teredinibacter turnerae]
MGDSLLPLQHLLPLRSVVVCLQCVTACELSFFHQPAMSAFLRNLLDHPDQFDQFLLADTPESGRLCYNEGDFYRFTVLALAGGEVLLARLLARLRNLPAAAVAARCSGAFADNWRCAGFSDGFNQQPIAEVAELSEYTHEVLLQETAPWLAQPVFAWHWSSPVRLLKEKSQRGNARGEHRYCRTPADLSVALLLSRLFDALAQLLRNRAIAIQHRPAPPSGAFTDCDLFWVDAQYRHADGEANVMGGMLGVAGWLNSAALAPWWPLLVLGQYVGIGQRRSFGWGRYELLTADAGVSYRRSLPAAPLLARAMAIDNLWQAYCEVANKTPGSGANAIAASRTSKLQLPPAPPVPGEPDDYPPELWPRARVQDHLHTLASVVLNQQYRVPPLQGWRTWHADGRESVAMAPLFWDRVLQQAVKQLLESLLASLQVPAHKTAPQQSPQQTAKNGIESADRKARQQALQQGYRWAFRATPDDLLLSANRQRAYDRLRALCYDDPLLDLIADWLAAPVALEGSECQRAGLPLGSPLSPLLADLLLDDFGRDMAAAGFYLLRTSHEVTVLSRSQQHAQHTAAVAYDAVQRREPARVQNSEHRVNFSGYVFVNNPPANAEAQISRKTDAHYPANATAEFLTKAAHNPPPNAFTPAVDSTAWLARVSARPLRELKPEDEPSDY